MQTTPQIVVAPPQNAGAVHPCTRKTADVAINVAIVIPDTGLAEDPTNPTMRELTVTKRNPNTTTSRTQAGSPPQPKNAPGPGLNWRKRNMQATISSEPINTTLIERSFSVRI